MAQSVFSSPNKDLAQLRERLGSRLDKTRQAALVALQAEGAAGYEILRETLLAEKQTGQVSWLSGSIYRSLCQDPTAETQAFLQQRLPQGLLPLQSARGVDYGELEQLLLQERYREADVVTLAKLCELAGEAAIKRKWVYFSEVNQLPKEDLRTLDQLWRIYSQGLFGFSVQREIWLSVGQVWEALWPRIGWKSGNTWTRYPGSFTWDLNAPRGHLPLTNQLRGVRVMSSLMNHPAFAPEQVS